LFVAEQRADHFLGKDDISGLKNITIAIGPEGGWNEFELNFMEERGFKQIRLSNTTLRVENAINAILSQIELLINQ
jgi:RsmE family RNA methyltransferase